ncbi:MAG: hypothetical protein ABI639_08695 [Thermoanaerobaculia bacterium]
MSAEKGPHDEYASWKERKNGARNGGGANPGDPMPGNLAVWFSPRLVLGLAIVVFGSILLLDNLNLVEAQPLLRYFFPGVLMLVGMTVLAQRSIWGWLWIAAGAWVLGEKLEVIQVDFFSLFLPATLVLVGGSLVYRTFVRPTIASRTTPAAEDPSNYVRAFAVMSGNERRLSAAQFRGGDLAAFMGGVNLDLRQSKIGPEGAVLDAFAFWGGIEIKVPENWQVRSEVLPLMGGYEDKTRPNPAAIEGTLVIRGFAIMGSVEVSN